MFWGSGDFACTCIAIKNILWSQYLTLGMMCTVQEKIKCPFTDKKNPLPFYSKYPFSSLHVYMFMYMYSVYTVFICTCTMYMHTYMCVYMYMNICTCTVHVMEKLPFRFVAVF